MVCANSTSRPPRLRPSFSASIRLRISIEFSGVRSSCDMLARNSDLYFEESASWAAFSSRPRRASSISSFLISMSRFCSDSSRAFSWSSSLVFRSSSDCFCNSVVRLCDWASSSSVRMFARIVLSTTPMVSVIWSRKSRFTSEKGRIEASSITPSTWSSNSTGITRMSAASASPRPEATFR